MLGIQRGGDTCSEVSWWRSRAREVTEEQVCPWWHCLDCVPPNHLTCDPHGLPTVIQKAVFPHHFLGEEYGAPGISEGSEIQGFQGTLHMSFPSWLFA